MKRTLGCSLLGLVVLAGAIAHWAYWYRPRARAMAPAESALLRERDDLPVTFWVPFPHQNLAALGGAVERPRDVLAAAARLAGLPPPNVPRLGPFGLPAGRELRVSASADGRQLRVAIRCYPTTMVVARLAGALASNPWLAGGTVTMHDGPARVRWEGLTWRLSAGSRSSASGEGNAELGAAAGAAQPARAAALVDRAPALALLDLAWPSPPLAAGAYVLRAEGDDLVWRLGAPLAAPPSPGALQPPWFLVWMRRRPEQAQALLLFEPERQGLLQNLPAAAAWAAPSGALKLLPGGSFLHKLANVEAQPFASGELAATEASAADAARALGPRWLPLAEGRTQPPLLLSGWVAIGPATRQAEQLHAVLEDIPFLGGGEAQRWGDVATLLRAAHAYRTLSCWLTLDGRQGELRLSPR